MSFVNRAGRAGGYYGTSIADEDIMPDIKTQEEAIHGVGSYSPPYEISIRVGGDTTIKINDGSSIKITATEGYDNDSVYISKISFGDSSIEYYIAYNF